MAGYRTRSVGWVFVTRMIAIICFLIVVVLANILTYYVMSPVYNSGVAFINGNFWLMALIAVILLVADLFSAFPFPLDLPAPVIRAVGSVFCIAFILRVFQWVDTVAATSLYPSFWLVSFVVVPLVFLIVLATGYFNIFRRFWRQPEPDAERSAKVVPQEPFQDTDQPAPDTKSWEEIGAEFRMMLYDVIHRFREDIKRR